MAETQTYSVYNRSDRSLMARSQAFPLPGVPVSMRRDPEALCENVCPPELEGKLYLLEQPSRASLGRFQTHGSPSYGTPNFDEGTIVVSYSAVALPISAHKARMIAAVKEKAAGLVADGFTYAIPGESPLDPHVYSIADEVTQVDMLAVQTKFNKGSTNCHGGHWRCMSNHNVAMDDAEVQAFFDAAYDYKMGIRRRMSALADAIRNAANASALNLIDIDAGTVNGAGGWPTNGS